MLSAGKLTGRRGWLSPLVFFILIWCLVFTTIGCGSQQAVNSTTKGSSSQVAQQPASNVPQHIGTGKLQVSFLDVGQGDSILVRLPNQQVLLIDAGTYEHGPVVVSDLQARGVKQINYLVATHPHADHIGGMEHVVNSFPIGQIYMPKVATTTRGFKELLLTIQGKGLKINTARAGVTLYNDGNLQISFLAPCDSSYKALNNWSAVTRLKYGKTTFLFTGDAQAESEAEMLRSGAEVKADLLKIGHHGSYSSTTSVFLSTVAPQYAVISVGAGNDYGHPHQVILNKLAAAGVTVYRTDRDGTIEFVSDGKNISMVK